MLLLLQVITTGINIMINLKEHFKLSAIYTFFAVFPALLQLIVYPVIEGENRLVALDFGYLGITEAIISMIFLICTFGMGTGVARFYHDYRDDAQGYSSLVSSILNGIIGRGILLMGLVLLFAPFIGQLFPQPDLQNFGHYGPSLVIAGFNRSVIATLLVLYRNEKRVRAFVIVSFCSGVLRAGFQLAGVFIYDLSFIGYVFGTATGGAILAVGLVIYTFNQCGFHYKKKLLNEVHKFAGPLFLTELIYWGLLFADRFFLLNNPEELGIYDNAMKFAIGIQLIIQGLTSAVQPEIFRLMKEGMKKKRPDINVLSNLFIAEAVGIIALTIIPVMLFINIFYETELTLSAGLISIVFVRLIFRAQYQVFAWPLLFKKKTRLFFYINSVVLLINLSINWFLTPQIGYYGAIIAFLTAFLVQVTALKILQTKYVPVRNNSVKVFYFPLAIIFSAAILEIIKVVLSLNPFVTSGILVILIICGIILLYRKELFSVRL